MDGWHVKRLMLMGREFVSHESNDIYAIANAGCFINGAHVTDEDFVNNVTPCDNKEY